MPQIVRKTVVTEYLDPEELLDVEDEDQEEVEDDDEVKDEPEEKRPRRRVRLLGK